MLLTRRDLLDLAVRAAALPGAAEFFSAWFQAAGPQSAGRLPPPEPPLLREYPPKFFCAEDFAALQAFTEILIPTDETPSAREAPCPHLIQLGLHASTAAAPAMQ